MMKEKQEKLVIDVINQLPRETHVCLFYQSKNDLIDILIPYFRQGLEENELCVWATSESLEAEEAEAALKKEVKNLDYYIKRGQIEILDARTLYIQSGKLEAGRVLKFWAQDNKWELIGNSIHEHKEKAYSEANARLRILQQVSEAVHSSLDLENVFKQITKGAVHIMGYTTAFIVTLDKAKRHFEIRALSTKE